MIVFIVVNLVLSLITTKMIGSIIFELEKENNYFIKQAKIKNHGCYSNSVKSLKIEIGNVQENQWIMCNNNPISGLGNHSEYPIFDIETNYELIKNLKFK